MLSPSKHQRAAPCAALRPRRSPFDKLRVSALVGLLLLQPAPALADSLLPPSEYSYTQLADPKQEAQAKALMETLRCIVCQGQSIADSDAEMAGDMRALVRQRIEAGERPEQIRQWLIDRYRSEEHTSELQSRQYLVCRLLLEK